ncbi:hypothetical protein [Mangrovimonas sp. DI 80]|uniref:hypothetical protein n=1 Tax=Mangrovimonas sp. DI 80 TaxID=1779330 RepID=UPI000976F7D9|nr:hypothetical protein [Mangrovimonas sp. DI 80]OMP31627.1 hypothetical protein BKM32_00700 [Mangrovimonas sp. DI 80]
MAKSDTDDQSVTFRIPRALKNKINQRAEMKGVRLSEYLRELLTSVVEDRVCQGERERIKELENQTFLSSKEFMQLLVWMYSKREAQKYNKETDYLDDHIKTLKQVGDHVPVDLSKEFDKVLKSLLSIDRDNSYSTYDFIKGYGEKEKFDFEKLEKFLLSKPIKVPNLPPFPLKKTR